MRIIELRAENFKRLKAVTIRPGDEHVVQITGQNGMGKTSVLDAILVALAGQGAIQSQPIRTGSTKATVSLDLGEFRVVRHFSRSRDGTDTTTRLVVEAADGARYPSPQAMLDKVVGSISLDPLQFARAPAKEQLATLAGFVADFDFAAAAKQQAEDYERRSVANRRAREMQARADGIAVPQEPVAAEDEAALIEELDDAGRHNTAVERAGQRRSELEKLIENYSVSIDATLAEAAKLRQELEALDFQGMHMTRDREAARKQLRELAPVPDRIDTREIRERLRIAREVNERARQEANARETREALLKEAQEAESTAKQLSAQMKARDDAKAEAIAKARMPVEGLGLDDLAGHVTYQGLPFDQASDAEQLRVSLAIAMAANPKLRVLRVRDGSLLDDKSMRLIGEMATEQDYQLWLERVDGSGQIGFVLVDGELQSAAES